MKTIFSSAYNDKQEAVKQLLDTFQTSGSMIGKGNRNVVKVFDLNGINVNVKAFKVPHLLNKIVYRFFRESKAKRSFDFAEKLLSMGVLTPQPVACFEEKSAFLFLRSFYISEQLDYDLTYRELILNPDYKEHEAILRAFTKFTFDLHEKGIFFKDHSPGNTLINIVEDGFRFYLVDLNRMEFKPLDFDARMRNFERLTPKKEMVAIMANEYAKIASENETRIFNDMLKYTEAFQYRFYRKKKLKNKWLFWRKK